MKKIEQLRNEFSTTGLVSLVMDLQVKLLAGFDEQRTKVLLESVSLFGKSMNCFGIPLAITEQAPEKLGSSVDTIVKDFVSDSTFQKVTFSAFGSRQFCDWLEQSNFDHLLLSGIETSICIHLTALEGLKRGFCVTILSDCVLSRRDDDGTQSLRALANAGAQVISLESLIYGIMGSSDHPNFKEITSLVRNRSFSFSN